MGSIYTVSQVNSYIKNMFTQDFALNKISVKGEVSNCKYHPSGHIYFTLKDGGSQIGAVMFASQRKNLGFKMEEGQQVVAQGTVDVYERDGKYQLYARSITLDGTGDLFRRFEQLRNELEEMGMFDGCYKQPIPRYAKRVGVVTASTGAAIRDIMNISARRNPYVQLILYPALVQGTEAKYSIVKGIQTLDRMNLDVIIVGRGGGSIEDLWAFNEEMVARAIFECGTPVISAVGHETDVTIADYVADMRAPTPSAAAELAVFDYSQFEAQTDLYRRTLNRGMERRLERVRYRLNQDVLRLKMHHPERQLNEKRQRLADLEDRMGRIMEQRVTAGRHRLALLAGRLQSLSPLEQISRGYGFITDGGGKRLESVSQVKPGDRITVRVRDGRAVARVEETESLDDRKGGELT
ncbi:exodeoxyribonuclease VII large subunit [Enterocloster lavalensis]|uniref:exodeoxyribonuclease VII large subunit n=1 Tax=Enterocloster lavalensis TaxID=460384 RepID=UPI000D1BBEC9|nr:exodeoxyribonuclease VII large subunit [Enterocloster lavalensis]MBS5603200.1 exodeoxyribonuclease VII large subunit [Enterocloster asparagiformis]MCB6345879.1 exodeoxyribonuclease VII large subunit [Enterocloster lavalensis]PST34787.1 exodeoxyribonuclease VII large subunit [Enterocloster lavalensis]